VGDGLGYSPDKAASCTLYGGTTVAQARGKKGQKALAQVCRTSFCSAKGQLLRSILFPNELNESFISDSVKFIGIMLTAAILMYIWSMFTLISVGASTTRIVIRFFDMITVAVPPSLPACLTIATVFSIGRLRKKVCAAPPAAAPRCTACSRHRWQRKLPPAAGGPGGLQLPPPPPRPTSQPPPTHTHTPALPPCVRRG
jgi:hypothetical protein